MGSNCCLVQIKETEKAVQLTKEMQLALHPEHGRAEVKALESDVRRAELRLSDLHATQHRLQNDLSNVIAKRETYIVKVSAPNWWMLATCEMCSRRMIWQMCATSRAGQH